MREFIKTQVGEFPNTRWEICNYYKSDEPPQPRNPNIENMTIVRSDGKNLARISGGPIVCYFIDEKDADEYIWFKTHQHNLKFKTHY